MRIKCFLITTLALLLAVFSVNGQKKIYITLDVSGSMTGDKYSLANYTAQMISVLCDNDEVTMIICEAKKISGKNAYKKLHRSINAISQNCSSQISDIETFNKLFDPNSKMEQWLFIIGDGIWGTEGYKDLTNDFKVIVNSGKINICYLQTGTVLNENNDFTVFLQSLKIIDILKSSTDPETIIESCNKIASKILGISTTSLQVKKDSRQCAKVESLLPTKQFIAIYQDEAEVEFLPVLSSVKYGEKVIGVNLKGSPSTEPLLDGDANKLLSSHIWEVNAKDTIPANTPLLFCFDKGIDIKKLKIFPVFENLKLNIDGLGLQSGFVKEINETTNSVCKDEETATVTVSLSDDNGQALPEKILEMTNVTVYSNNNSYKATLKNGVFECDIPLTADTVMFYSQCECPGYFIRTSPINTIIRELECNPEDLPVETLPNQYMGDMRFNDFMRGNCIEGFIYDSLTLEVLDPLKFDITVEHNYKFLFKSTKVNIDGNKLSLCVEPRGKWCDCYFPDTLEMNIKIVPKPTADFDGKIYSIRIIPIKVRIIKENSWWTRCKWVVFAIIIIGLFILYLNKLLKKPRFKKGAILETQFKTPSLSRTIIGSIILRKAGFVAWVNRWFNPFVSESLTFHFDKPNKTFRFIADPGTYRIRIPKEQYDENKMYCSSFEKDDKKKFFTLSDSESIQLKNVRNIQGADYNIVYVRNPGANDIALFKAFLGIVIFGLSVLVCFLIFSLRYSF